MSRAGLRWTPDELEQLQTLRERDNLDFPTIGARLERDPKSCEVQLCKLRRKLNSPRVCPPRWSADEDAALIKARETEDREWDDVAGIVGRSVGACMRRLTTIRTNRAVRHRADGGMSAARPDPASIAAGRAYRRAQDERPWQARFLNDPPPGYSALDRKRQGLAP